MNVIFCFPSLSEENIKYVASSFEELGLKIDAMVSVYDDIVRIKKVLPNMKAYCSADYNHPYAWDFDLGYFTYQQVKGHLHDWNYPFDKELYDMLIKPKYSEIMPIIDRYEPFEGGFLECETRLIYEFSFANFILKTHKPNYLICLNEPHNPLYFLLIELAKYYKIKVMIVRTALFRHLSSVSSDVYAPILDQNLKKNIHTYQLESNLAKGEKMHERTRNLISEIIEKEENYVPDYLVKLGGTIRKREIYKELIISKMARKRLLYFGLNMPFGLIFKYRLLKNYINSTMELDINGKRPIIFFPLHFQPEQTTMPRGGEFSNQIRVIKMLSDALPENGMIIVKEHPFAFNPIARTTKNFRPVTYYSWLSRIPKVVLVSLNTSSSYLQNVSDYTCTITGNAGLEAMIRGKKVIVFGAASYLNGPNVYKIDSVDGLKKLFSMEVVENADDQERAIEYIESFSQFCYHSNEDFSDNLYKDLRDRHFIRTLLSAIKFEIKNN